MPSGKHVLLKVGLLLLVLGSLIFFHPFFTEPMWMEWILGPALFYLGFPLLMVGIAIRVFGNVQKSGGALSESKTHG
jgi:hypothetical protein